ncbi:MAG: gamma-glutamyltransferase, partial [Candidatus Acidiferrales bacterium]
LAALLAGGPLPVSAQTPHTHDAVPAGSGQPDVLHSAHAMIVADEPQAADVGLEILRRGGNAVDAAVAVAFALAVTHPQAGNIGGGGFMLIRKANGETVFIDYREAAPAAATAEMYLDAEGNVTPKASTEGWRASAVPGTVAGLEFALKNHGTQPWDKVIDPAIRLADKGFLVSPRLSEDIQENAAKLSRFAETRDLFLRDGKALPPGEKLKQKNLARTLKTIAQGGARAFYQGSIAATLESEMKRNGGLITRGDLAAYQVKVRQPLVGHFRGFEIVTAPPPSSGGVALLEMLNTLDLLLPADARAQDTAAIHVVAESMRRAFADRARYLADPDFACIPVAALTSPEYAARLSVSINRERASSSAGLKMPDALAPVGGGAGPASGGVGCKPGAQVAGREGSNTTHISVIDSDGNAVANTYTLNDSFGSGVTVPGLGFLLNDEMDDFTAKPGAPNMFKLVQSDANKIGPGKRPLSSMTPTIVARDGKTVLVLGSPGGGRIINSVLLVLLNRLAFKLPLPEAVALPRYHHQWLPDTLFVEKEMFTGQQLDALRALGHDVRDVSEMSSSGPKFIGQVNAIERDPKNGELIGVGDGRRGGVARAH